MRNMYSHEDDLQKFGLGTATTTKPSADGQKPERRPHPEVDRSWEDWEDVRRPNMDYDDYDGWEKGIPHVMSSADTDTDTRYFDQPRGRGHADYRTGDRAGWKKRQRVDRRPTGQHSTHVSQPPIARSTSLNLGTIGDRRKVETIENCGHRHFTYACNAKSRVRKLYSLNPHQNVAEQAYGSLGSFIDGQAGRVYVPYDDHILSQKHLMFEKLRLGASTLR